MKNIIYKIKIETHEGDIEIELGNGIQVNNIPTLILKEGENLLFQALLNPSSPLRCPLNH